MSPRPATGLNPEALSSRHLVKHGSSRANPTSPGSLAVMWSRASPVEGSRGCCATTNCQVRARVFAVKQTDKAGSLVSELLAEPKPTESSALKATNLTARHAKKKEWLFIHVGQQFGRTSA